MLDFGTEKKQCFDEYENRTLIMSDEKCGDCEHLYECRFNEVVYGRAVEQLEHDILYEPTFNKDDGSM